MIWPFRCKNCAEKDQKIEAWRRTCHGYAEQNKELKDLNDLQWFSLSEQMPPLKTNLLVANKDFSYFGFLYLEDGWDHSKRITMHSQDVLWPTYTNRESIVWWLNIDQIKKNIQ